MRAHNKTQVETIKAGQTITKEERHNTGSKYTGGTRGKAITKTKQKQKVETIKTREEDQRRTKTRRRWGEREKTEQRDENKNTGPKQSGALSPAGTRE